MVAASAYALIFGVPAFAVLFSIALNIIGKRIFVTAKNGNAAGSGKRT